MCGSEKKNGSTSDQGFRGRAPADAGTTYAEVLVALAILSIVAVLVAQVARVGGAGAARFLDDAAYNTLLSDLDGPVRRAVGRVVVPFYDATPAPDAGRERGDAVLSVPYVDGAGDRRLEWIDAGDGRVQVRIEGKVVVHLDASRAGAAVDAGLVRDRSGRARGVRVAIDSGPGELGEVLLPFGSAPLCGSEASAFAGRRAGVGGAR